MNWPVKLRLFLVGLLLASTSLAQTSGAPPLLDLQGQATSLAAYKGRMVFVNFWATWCAPCLKEMPELNQLYGSVDRSKVAIVGIAADEPADVKAFVTKLGIKYPIATGNPDQVFAWSAKLGNVNEGLPFSVLFDASGKIQWVKSGGRLTAAEATAAIDKLLAGSGKK